MFDPDEKLPPRRHPLREIAPVALAVLALAVIVTAVTLRLNSHIPSGAFHVGSASSSGDRPPATPAPRASTAAGGPIAAVREPDTTAQLIAASPGGDRTQPPAASADPAAPASTTLTAPPSGTIPPSATRPESAVRPADVSPEAAPATPHQTSATAVPIAPTAAPAASDQPQPSATTPRTTVPPPPAATTPAAAPPELGPTQPAPPPTSTPTPGLVDGILDTAADLLGPGR
jgi:hypothetical protein